MTTTIVPASGQGILLTQQGPGTTPGYSALDIRRAATGPLQEGVYGTSQLVTAGGVSNVGQADFMVTQRNAGANMSVDVNMPAGGFAWVQGDTINGQGLYGVPVAGANINETVATADPTNPRLDQLILEIQDNVLDATGGNQARTRVLTGTPTPGATTTNRLGATALPGNALLLADWITGAGVTSITNANIRDRRKWARGAHGAQFVTSGSLSQGGVWATLASQRLECSGVPLRLRFAAQFTMSNNISGAVNTQFQVDGAGLNAQTVNTADFADSESTSNLVWVEFERSYVPSAGSHVFSIVGFMTGGGNSGTWAAVSTQPLEFVVEERVRQNSINNAVTSG